MARPLEFLGQIRKLAEFIDLSKLPAVISAIGVTFDSEPSLDSPGGIETRIREFVSLAQVVTLATKTPEDDKIAAGLVTLASNDELLSLVAGALRWLIDANDNEPERLPVVDVLPFVAAGLDPGTLTAIIGLLAKLWELYKSWRNPAE